MLQKISRTTAKLFRDTYYETESAIEISLLRQGIKNRINFKKAFSNINGKNMQNILMH